MLWETGDVSRPVQMAWGGFCFPFVLVGIVGEVWIAGVDVVVVVDTVNPREKHFVRIV